MFSPAGRGDFIASLHNEIRFVAGIIDPVQEDGAVIGCFLSVTACLRRSREVGRSINHVGIGIRHDGHLSRVGCTLVVRNGENGGITAGTLIDVGRGDRRRSSYDALGY